MLLPYVQLTFHKLTLQTNIGICIGEIANIGLYEMINEWDIVAAYIHLSGPFLSTNFFSNNSLDMLPWTSYISGTTTDSLYGVLGRGWTTYLVRWSTLPLTFVNGSWCVIY